MQYTDSTKKKKSSEKRSETETQKSSKGGCTISVYSRLVEEITQYIKVHRFSTQEYITYETLL